MNPEHHFQSLTSTLVPAAPATGMGRADPRQTVHFWTLPGLALALLGLPTIVIVYRALVPPPSPAYLIVVREAAILGIFFALLAVIRYGERLPFSSIGLSGRLGRSLGWGLVGTVLLIAATAILLALLKVLHLPFGSGSHHDYHPPLAVIALTVLRAGIVEETFYRGYAIARLEALTGSRTLAVLVPLAVFALFHYQQGIGGILMAAGLGAVLTGFYLWRRDLLANMTAHVLIDFIPNVLLPLLGNG